MKVDNYQNWCKQMKIVFCCQDLWNLVKEGLESLEENATEEKEVAHKELKKKNYKTLFIIHQCLSPDNFKKDSEVEFVKEAWEILENSFGGAEKVKEVKLETHKRTYELI